MQRVGTIILGALFIAGGAVIEGGLTRAPAQGASTRELAALKADYKRPPAHPVENQKLVELGRLLFWDPRVSASGKTACATCARSAGPNRCGCADP